MEIADYTVHEIRQWRKVNPQSQIAVNITSRGLAALALAASRELKACYTSGKATPPACQFNRGGFDADRLPKRQERHTA